MVNTQPQALRGNPPTAVIEEPVHQPALNLLQRRQRPAAPAPPRDRMTGWRENKAHAPTRERRKSLASIFPFPRRAAKDEQLR